MEREALAERLKPGTRVPGFFCAQSDAKLTTSLRDSFESLGRRMVMRRRGFSLFVVVLAVSVFTAAQAFAQGGGASTTGSINGKVADTSGAVLPGVTVTASSPSLM